MSCIIVFQVSIIFVFLLCIDILGCIEQLWLSNNYNNCGKENVKLLFQLPKDYYNNDEAFELEIKLNQTTVGDVIKILFNQV